MSANLLPCPFCGIAAKIILTAYNQYGERKKVWGVECTNDDECGVTITGFVSEEAAIFKWNSRHIDPILLAFYNEVCDQAERNMAATNTVSGAHWNAMRQVLKAKGIAVSR